MHMDLKKKQTNLQNNDCTDYLYDSAENAAQVQNICQV